MGDPYRTNAPPPREPRAMTPEEEWKLASLDADCRDVLRPVSIVASVLAPPALVGTASVLLRRWMMLRRLRAHGVRIER